MEKALLLLFKLQNNGKQRIKVLKTMFELIPGKITLQEMCLLLRSHRKIKLIAHAYDAIEASYRRVIAVMGSPGKFQHYTTR